MKNIKRKYGSWALVAGAAEGLGEAYTRALTSRGMSVIMVDKKKTVMEELARKEESAHGIETVRIHADLAEPATMEMMMDAVIEKECRLVIYNAAYSIVKKFTDNSREDLERYTDINMRTVFRLIHAFVNYHQGQPREKKGIILMSSLAGLWGTRYLAPYGATKAFNRILAEALHHELKPDGFDVLACIAGATATPAYLATEPRYGILRPHVMDPADVAEQALRSLGRRSYCIPGFSNKATRFLLGRIFPGRTGALMFNRTVEKMYGGREFTSSGDSIS